MAADADFAAVDAGDTRALVAMMDATDAWPAVRAARAWVLEHAEVRGRVVVDVGCGPGTFGGSAGAGGAAAVDVDRSPTMLTEARRRRTACRAVLADATRLPVRAGAAHLVRAERVLQWTPDPHAALAELHRATAPGGWMAVTDTDWGTLAVDHPDRPARDRLTTAALGWVPHARFARTLPRAFAALGVLDVRVRADPVVLTAWDPDDPAQQDGPPGLPLRSITARGAPDDAAQPREDLEVLADRARRGTFHARLVLVTVIARREHRAGGR